MQKKLNIYISSMVLLLTACGAGGNKTAWEYMPDMTNSPAVKAQEEPMRLPPAETLPQNYEVYPYGVDQGELAGSQLSNPLEMTQTSLQRGQTVYNNMCIVCHGSKGSGEGSIVPKFPRSPSLLSDKVRDWREGRIYHAVMKGQNLTGSYASQVAPQDRWAVIQYVRALQRAAKPTPQDVEAFKKALKERTYP